MNRRARTYAKYEGSITKDDVWLAIAIIAANAITASASQSRRVSLGASDTLLAVASAPAESPVVNV